ncbi:Hypothetical protein PHPALM_13887 [Phytophthora palmivora]|uniref:Uncharacterized protein n=1 Tax=Phytophthora palmivora TaxID=4796 RepID=A0A2P4XW66_9STRA|nr:Hypothetical protein PHPALM_13887 [Phytophthora palmivora]
MLGPSTPEGVRGQVRGGSCRLGYALEHPVHVHLHAVFSALDLYSACLGLGMVVFLRRAYIKWRGDLHYEIGQLGKECRAWSVLSR